ncbi:RtcB family protein [Candidatus Woesearchaeota archaeon]|nr:RtcB family protein [Candidatus Woesearchaeota archaeon]
MEIKKISDVLWEIPKTGSMKVPCRVFASEKLLEKMKQDRTLMQGRNIAFLPGIYKYAIVMPDGHEGYGFPIGGVAALDYEKGGISPGGIGYDINCGVRLLKSNLAKEDVEPKIKELLDKIFEYCPAGLGSSNIRVELDQLNQILDKGAKWAVENGYGNEDDLKHSEENGGMKQADSKHVSDLAKKRGRKQIATLGSGNHFLEIQYIEKVFDKKVADAFGLKEGQVTFMIHCGSRGLGHQVCSDYLRQMEHTFPEIVKGLPDRELIYAPAGSDMAKKYFSAMAAAANFAWCNRHVLGHQTRLAVKDIIGDAKLETLYDVAHNIAKVEEHEIDGKMTKVWMHRKGATRAFGPGRKEIPEVYRDIGQPIIIPGSMGGSSYVLVGTSEGMEATFGSTAHGAGRVMSRHQAIKTYRGEKIVKELEAKGIHVKGASWKGIAEEAPGAYKDPDEVVRVSHEAGIGKLVVRLKPIGVVKG